MIDARKLLLEYGYSYFRIKAGYIPAKMPVPYDWIGELSIRVLSYGGLWRDKAYQSRFAQCKVELIAVCADCFHYKYHEYMPIDSENMFYYPVKPQAVKCELCGRY